MPEKHSLYAQIIVRGMQDPLTYGIPETLRNEAQVGDEVQVELRNRLERGWIIEISETHSISTQKDKDNNNSSQSLLFSEHEIKKKTLIKPVLTNHPAFNKEDLPFFSWISNYYGSPLYEVLENAVPKKSMSKPIKIFKLDKSKLDGLPEIISSLSKKAPAQAEALQYIKELNGEIPFSEIDNERLKRGFRELAKKDLLKIDEVAYSDPVKTEPIQGPDLLNEQQEAVNKISDKALSNTFTPFLLYGITGSGKTEVYISCIENVLKNNGRALLIVPEIALTPQIVNRFKERLGVPVSILHSRVGASSKWEAWQNIINNKVSLTIGARSAIFAPVKDLSLIIVDEEHESSYKQSDGLRYNARDLAIMKAKFNSCPVVLGSATPSFETLLNSSKKIYSLLELKERASKDSTLPEMRLVDMTQYKKSNLVSENISPPLYDEITKTLSNGEQVIIFYNRRGFANYLQCKSCGHVLGCDQCSVTLTYYQKKDKVSCHYCGESTPAPALCPKCHDKSTVLIEEEKKKSKVGKLEPRGAGTEKIYDEIQSLFPETKIERLDRESTSENNAIENILDRMHKGESQILIGTQMIAKGHDLPNVTLVGFINADVGLHFPDFRASERVYQLIVQASGRAGRGSLPGKVIIQTNEPDHPTIVAAISNRFKAFARYELEYRKNLRYPPYTRLARIVSSSTDREESYNLTMYLAKYLSHLSKNNENIEPWNVLGPSPAPIERLRGRYRWHFLIKSSSSKTLSTLAKNIYNWKHSQKKWKDFRITFDIDPVDML